MYLKLLLLEGRAFGRGNLPGIGLLCISFFSWLGALQFESYSQRPSSFRCRGLSVLIQVKYELYRHRKANRNVPKIFREIVRRHPEKAALIYEATDDKWTFRRLDEFSNAVANFFSQQGFLPGDVIAIFMESRPEFVGLWLGMAKVGIEAALINFNLRLDSLLYCVKTSGAKALIFGGELSAGGTSVRLLSGRTSAVSGQ